MKAGEAVAINNKMAKVVEKTTAAIGVKTREGATLQDLKAAKARTGIIHPDHKAVQEQGRVVAATVTTILRDHAVALAQTGKTHQDLKAVQVHLLIAEAGATETTILPDHVVAQAQIGKTHPDHEVAQAHLLIAEVGVTVTTILRDLAVDQARIGKTLPDHVVAQAHPQIVIIRAMVGETAGVVIAGMTGVMTDAIVGATATGVGTAGAMIDGTTVAIAGAGRDITQGGATRTTTMETIGIHTGTTATIAGTTAGAGTFPCASSTTTTGGTMTTPGGFGTIAARAGEVHIRDGVMPTVAATGGKIATGQDNGPDNIGASAGRSA